MGTERRLSEPIDGVLVLNHGWHALDGISDTDIPSSSATVSDVTDLFIARVVHIRRWRATIDLVPNHAR